MKRKGLIFCLAGLWVLGFGRPVWSQTTAKEAGLILEWYFAPASATVAPNQSGQGLDAIVRSGQRVKAGKGYALRCDGEDYAYNYDLPKSRFSANEFTIEIALRPDSLKEAATIVLLGNFKLSIGAGYRSKAILFLGDYDHFRYSREGAIRAKCWTHVAFVKKGTSLDCFIDGRLANGYATEIQERMEPPGSLTVGSVDNYKGLVTDVRLYDRALSASEIRKSYEKSSLPYAKKNILSVLTRLGQGLLWAGGIVLLVLIRKFWLERQELRRPSGAGRS